MNDRPIPAVLADFPDVLNFNQLQTILGIGRHSTYRLLQDNRITHVRVGKKYIIPKLGVIEFLKNPK